MPSACFVHRLIAAIALALMGVAGQARATLIVEISRISDTQGTLTLSGSLLSPAPSDYPHILSLLDPFGVSPVGDENTSIFNPGSNLVINGVSIDFANEAGPGVGLNVDNVPSLYFGSSVENLTPGSNFTGQLNLTLNGGATFAAIGSTGDVYWGVFPGDNAGTWIIVAPPPGSDVPDAGSSAALVVLGALALAVLRGRFSPTSSRD